MMEKSERHAQKGYKKIEREQMKPASLLKDQLHDIENDNRRCYDNGLTTLHAVDTSENVDGIGTENSQHAHINIVEQT